MKKIAVIPARGGSKRIPKKNIIDFMGKPLMAWTIEAAIQSNIFDRIILSTDDKEFAQVGEAYGIEVPFLRLDKVDDFSPVSEATISSVKQAERYFNEKYDVVVQLMANTPLRKASCIINHINKFFELSRDFQISAFQFGWMNPWWAAKIDKGGSPEWVLPDGFKKRSQDLPKLFCPTGAIWIAKVADLIESNTFYGINFKFCELDWVYSVDIDDYDDLEFAKAIYILKNNV